MFIIGICGAIGSGKSYVSKSFSEFGIKVIDTDKVYKDICVAGSDVLCDIKINFGENVISSDGSLDRKALASVVFSDKQKLEKLNEITHHYIKAETQKRLDELRKNGEKYAVVEVPLMYESGFDKLCDKVIGVVCDKDTRIKRIMKRDGFTKEEALARIEKQHSDDYYNENADYIICNGEYADVKTQIKEFIYILRKENNMENRKENLMYEPKSVYDEITDEKKTEMYKYAEGYKAYMDSSKTEREAVKTSIALAEEKGFKEYSFGDDLTVGGKYYYNNRNKSLYLFTIGTESPENGVRIAAAHIDSPRVDLKQRPLYEDSGLAFFKTHYYGGIKKYQWTTVPLALHGVVVLSDGTKADVSIGEDESDPVFYIDDLLPHLAADQMQKKASEVISGEALNILIGSEPISGDYDTKEKIKLNVLSILNEKYGMTEADFLSAELCAVPSAKARDVGFDRSLVCAYGHDDRVCAYPAVSAILECESPKSTLMTILADKEEIGSEGNSGMQCEVFIDILSEIAKASGANFGKVKANSKCLSADVNAAFDPNFAEVFEKRNACFVNRGVVLTKYTGARGKSGTSDASAEFVAYVRNIFDKADVVWQTSELGKVDIGGGGTVAKYIAKYNIDVVDLGVPVISMHAPIEVISKGDLYNTYLAIKAFYKY